MPGKRILLVEDDYTIRRYIADMIPWEEHGYTIAGETDNGKSGLDLIYKIRPDIVLTDVQMPQMDGVTLIKELRTMTPMPVCIVISAFDNFQYVRDAMKYGAADYVLKNNLSPEELLPIIDAACSLSKRKNEKIENIEREAKKVEYNLRKNEPAIKENLLRNLQNAYDDKTKQGLENYQIPTAQGCYFVIDLLIREQDSYWIDKKEENVLAFGIVNIGEEILGTDLKCFGGTADNRLFSFLCGGSIHNITKIERSRYPSAHNIIEALRKYYGLDIACGISSITSDLNNIYKAFHEAQEALFSYFYYGYNRIIIFEQYLLSNQTDFVTHQLDLAFDEGTCSNGLLPAYTAMIENLKKAQLCRQALLKILRYVEAKTILYYTAQLSNSEIKKHVLTIDLNPAFGDTIQEYEIKVRKQIVELDKEWKCQKEMQYNRSEISDAVSYVQQNFARDITLDEIAKYVNLSRVYFSQLFKKEVGKSFTEYLIQYRIEEAKRLLLRGNLKVYEVGDHVGIPDTHYFCRLFKSFTGLSPAAFREQNKNEN